MVGQFSALEHKSIEPMALQVEGGKVRAMQRLVSEALWDEDAMRETYHRLVRDEMGEPDGVLIVDETGFAKKGQDSGGVARQYCGALGKVENCQVGVFTAYASRQGYALVDKRLFIPEPWFTEAYQARRTKCKLPDEIGWQSKPQSLNLSHFVEDQNDPSTSQILPSWPSVQWWGRAPPVGSVPPVQRRSADESCAGTERTPRILAD
jgi:hypothetical protein